MAATPLARIARRIGRTPPAALAPSPSRYEIAELLARVDAEIARRTAA